MQKIINSNTAKYQPMLTDNLVLDDKPTVNSFNTVTSDGVARAIAGASGEVPAVTEADNGKVLTAVYDEGGAAVEWADAQGGDVDQTYDATSTNAQSGVAVAQAIAAIPAPEDEVNVASNGPANTEVTFLSSPSVTLAITSSSVNQTGLTALTYDRGVATSINGNTTFLMFKLDGKPQYLTGANGGQLIISEDLAFPVTGQGAWNRIYVFPVNPSNPNYGDATIPIQGSPIVNGVITAGTYALNPMTGHPSLSSDYSDLAVLIQLGGSSQSVVETAQQFLIDNASKFSIKWRGETYRSVIPSVDNSYNATSNNAQSGKAVAQALATLPTIPSGSATINLSNNAYSVNYGSTLKSPTQTVTGTFDAPSATLDTTSTTYYYSNAYGCGTPLTQDFADVANSGGSIAISFSAGASNMFTMDKNAPYGDLIDGMRPGCWFIYNGSDPTKCILLPGSAVGCASMFGSYFYVNITSSRVITLDFSNVVCFNGATLSDVTAGTWYLGFCSKTSTNSCPTTTQYCWGGIFSSSSTTTVPANTYSGSIPSPLDVSNPLPDSTVADASKVLTVNAQGSAEWTAPIDYTMVYNTTPAGGSLDGTPWQAVQAGKRIGVVVPYSAFSGSLAAGSLYSSGKIYMPLASVVDRGSGEYRWNFYLYDGSNKWSLVLTCEEDEWSWGTPNVVAG